MPAVTEEMVLTALRHVKDPELNHNLVELGMIQEIEIIDDYVHVDIQLTTPHCPFADTILSNVRDAVKSVPGVNRVEVERGCLKND
jgi:ATP-binding protein involved in chromosome partitioning